MKKIKHIFAGACIAVLLAPRLMAEADNMTADNTRELYEAYSERFASITSRNDISENGFQIVESQIFPFEPEIKPETEADSGEESDTGTVPDEETSSGIYLIPAFDSTYHRLALFLTDTDGNILYKTDQLATNSRVRGQMEQPVQEIASIAFQDLNGDMRTDIILITSSLYQDGNTKKKYKVGDVLFQSENAPVPGSGNENDMDNDRKSHFYRDYRISDKLNRFGMNKNAKSITAFVKDGYSTEFLYTAVTLKELKQHHFQIIPEQCYTRTFEKLGKLQVVPGTFNIADYDVFMIYLVNEQGDIVSALQPMGDYDNLYALKGINCRDIDGDGLKDIVVLAKYSYEDENHKLAVASDYSIYYQRTGGFSADTEIKGKYQCGEEDTMQILVEKARAYWGWKTEND
ncbi:MAG: VCBS repeat-containing protein [Lachnospiraceae bacterium]|nr:VCBS repeat-containing protein [Lachnospiraceae bacterium]